MDGERGRMDPDGAWGAEGEARAMEILLGRIVAAQLDALGLPPGASDLSEIRAALKLLPAYEPWLAESLRALSALGHLATEDGRVRRIGTVESLEEAWSHWRAQAAWREHPRLQRQFALAEVTLRALPEILRGRRSAVEVMFPDGDVELVRAVYEDNPAGALLNDVLADMAAGFVEEVLARDPQARIRVLELGAGTGGTTRFVLSRLKPFGDRIAEYAFTDLSAAFLPGGQARFGDQAGFRTAVVDVELDLASQALTPGAYDLVIAANVLHATRDIRAVLRNIRPVLRRGGLLLLNELTGHSLFAHVTFGLLEGWWRAEDRDLRLEGGPGLSVAAWARVLAEEGFGEAYFPVPDLDALGQQVIVAERDATTGASAAPPTALSRSPQPPAIRSEAPPAVDTKPSDTAVRTLVREIVARGLKLDPGRIAPDLAFSDIGVDSIVAVKLVKEINRALAIDMPAIAFFDYNCLDQLVAHILDQHRPVVAPTSAPRDNAPPPAAPMVRAAPVAPIFPETPAASYRRIEIIRPGEVADLKMGSAPIPALEPGQVRIAVRAFALNFSDLLCVQGLYPSMPPYPFTPGAEASGVVVEVAPDVAGVRLGEEVIALAGPSLGAQANMLVCPQTHVLPKPAGLTFEAACALPAVSLTAIRAFRRAELGAGETVLIQTAAGGVGLAAVQLARHLGAEVIATAGSQPKLDHLRGLGVSKLINYRETDFEAEVQRLTDGRGVDVVLNTLSGDAIQKGLRLLAPGGRYVEIAMTALRGARAIDLSGLGENQSVHAVDLARLFSVQPEVLRADTAQMLALAEAGVLRPTLSGVFDFDDIHEAYRHLAQRENIGKVVVSLSEERRFQAGARVDVAPRPETPAAPTGGATPRGPIAIIGASGRFPKSANLEELWGHLAAGTDLVDEVTRWNLTGAAHRDTYCRRGGFLDDIAAFDPLFFNISGAEATYMDPQQRIFLEEAWRALEDAGYVGAAVDGKACGVYVGCSAGDYVQLLGPEAPAQSFWGNVGSITPARIAYFLNLHGPAIAVDTACSSSLVAIHLACQALWSGEIELALAGGVYVQSTPGLYVAAERADMLSPDGRCAAFDAAANGFVPGEGAAAIVLKRLDAALADGDHILGVIAGSGVNQDGATNGITAPSALSQERLERRVYADFGLDPGEVQMVEAHGTGTLLGDPIEVRALTRAFRSLTAKTNYCALGSIKTNLGHAVTAAGVAGVVKVLLALRAKAIPPSLHFQQLNPNITLEGGPFYVADRLRPWTVGTGERRRAAVSSFGFSGTNAHLVIEEAPSTRRPPSVLPAYLFVLSARTAEQLRRQARALADHVRRQDLDPGDVSFTLLEGRRRLDHRLACVACDLAELAERLEQWLGGGEAAGLWTGTVSRDAVAASDLDVTARTQVSALGGRGGESYALSLGRIADLFIRGARLEGSALFAKGTQGRVSLPTYPFSQDRFWAGSPVSAAVPASAPMPRPPAPADTAAMTEQTLAPIWIDAAEEVGAPWPGDGSEVIIVGPAAEARALLSRLPGARAADPGPEADIEAWTRALAGPVSHLIWLGADAGAGADPGAMIAGQAGGALSVYRIVKALLKLGHGNRNLGLTLVTRQASAVLPGEPIDPTQAAVHGLAGSLAKEQPDWSVRVADMPALAPLAADDLLRLAADAGGEVRAWREGTWRRRILVPIDLEAPPAAYRKGGVFVVLGGAGGVGEAWSAHVIARCGAQVVWIGRRAEDAAITAKRDRLAALGPRPFYLSADATDLEALKAAFAEIEARYGRIDGVVHSAIVLRDQSLANMSEADFSSVLAAKLDTSVNLALALEGRAVDFVLFFSSLQSFGTAPGQANYAAGCAFKDAFALWLAQRRPGRVKVMNWGFWGEVGIVATPEHRARMARLGVGSVDPEAGMAALDRLMSGALPQLAFLKASPSARPAEGLRVLAPGGLIFAAPTIGSPAPEGPAGLAEFEAALVDRLWGELCDLGLYRLGRFDIESAMAGLGIARAYGRWLAESLMRLEAAGRLAPTVGGGWTVLGEPGTAAAARAVWSSRRATWLEDRQLAAMARLAEAALDALPQLLTGRMRAVEALFPEGSIGLVEAVYKTSVASAWFNAGLAQTVAAYVAARRAEAPTAKIRILEIGAGSGGATETVLEALDEHGAAIAEYVYSDLSQTFLAHGRERYGAGRPWLTFRILDVEKPLSAQGLEVGGYDLVIGANVLHATRDIGRTLRHVKGALKTHGLLVLNEISGNSLSAHLTFGLLEGWWLYEDAALRLRGCPGLAPETWARVLAAEGFQQVRFPAEAGHGLGQQIVVAQSDGVVRQPAVAPQVPPAIEIARGAEMAVPGAGPAGRDGLAEIEGDLARQVAELLMLPSSELDPDTELGEYGFDSLSFTQLVSRLNAAHGLDLKPSVVFSYPTLRALARHLAEAHGVGASPPPQAPAPAQRAAPLAPPAAAVREPVARQASVASREPVAVIGMSGAFPGAGDVSALWSNLLAERDAIGEIPADRWDWRAIPGAVRWGGFLSDVAGFDPLFFGISPHEAELMDPQQRLLLMHAWKALEDAGIAPSSLSGTRTAVFVGTGDSGYGALASQGAPLGAYSATGTVPSMGPNRLSYWLNLRGPSEPIETACSSAMVAIHRGVQVLLDGSCDLAIVGGINTLISPAGYVGLGATGALSPDGRCRTFSAQANGYVRAEGVGVLVLRRRSEAEARGEPIQGLILASAENHGGRGQSLTAPNPIAQAELIVSAFQKAGIDPRTVGYMEAHGTGTALGDPIEIDGLKSAFRTLYAEAGGTGETPRVGVGSVKSNIGHLELAAGVAGVIKTLLQMRHGVLVKSLHADELNPYIQLEGSPFYVVRETQAWPRLPDGRGGSLPRRAGVSSFGFGGVNAHVVLEEHVETARRSPAASGPSLLVLSARTPERLRVQAEQLLAALEAFSEEDLGDIAYTLQVGRDAMEARLGLTAGSLGEARAKLAAWLADPSAPGLHQGQVKASREALSVFSGEDLGAVLDGWIAGQRHDKLLEVWVRGLEIDWSRLHPPGTRRRISLPTYPFLAERCWPPKAEPARRSTAPPTRPPAAGYAAVIQSLKRGESSADQARADLAALLGIVDE